MLPFSTKEINSILSPVPKGRVLTFRTLETISRSDQKFPNRLADELRPVFDKKNSIMIACFPYPIAEKETKREPPMFWDYIQPFAQKDHYRQAVDFLKPIRKKLAAVIGLAKASEIRLFSNSAYPEKKLALLAGLGYAGKNNLLITPEWGSYQVLAGMDIPVELEENGEENIYAAPGIKCGNCRICIENCPSNALSNEFYREKCLQNDASRDFLPDLKTIEQWGNFIYGCSACQQNCPLNQKASPLKKNHQFDWDPRLEDVLTMTPDELKLKLKKTALSMNWISKEALLRNALIAYAKSGRKEEAINSGLASPCETVKETARLLAKLQND